MTAVSQSCSTDILRSILSGENHTGFPRPPSSSALTTSDRINPMDALATDIAESLYGRSLRVSKETRRLAIAGVQLVQDFAQPDDVSCLGLGVVGLLGSGVDVMLIVWLQRGLVYLLALWSLWQVQR